MRTSKIPLFGALVMTALLAGTGARAETADEGDPIEGVNRAFYNFNDGLDKHFFQPLAEGYVKITPDPVRQGVTNFFDNVSYLNVIFNDILQGKLLLFVKDSSRFVVNSTLGIGGLFDPATSMGLPQNDEDLGQSFGVWGAGEGAYLVLPLFGPDSIRDVGDRVTSMLLNPLFYVSSIYTFPLQAVNAINTRANLLEESRVRDQAALDPYVFTREAYRQRRDFLIFDGNPPSTGLDEFLDEDMEESDTPGVLKVF
ncbi:MAG: VacJ family lipoprotein [Phycisphaerales bacterium]|nr:VacJ family lipoprotein [Phycisphaerales bacterium]MCC7410978.1 VacJ family lipoprotein [Gammaproteobacteria bacterium]